MLNCGNYNNQTYWKGGHYKKYKFFIISTNYKKEKKKKRERERNKFP